MGKDKNVILFAEDTQLLGLQLKDTLVLNTVSGSQHRRDPVWESNCVHTPPSSALILVSIATMLLPR